MVCDNSACHTWNIITHQVKNRRHWFASSTCPNCAQFHFYHSPVGWMLMFSRHTSVGSNTAMGSWDLADPPRCCTAKCPYRMVRDVDGVGFLCGWCYRAGPNRAWASAFIARLPPTSPGIGQLVRHPPIVDIIAGCLLGDGLSVQCRCRTCSAHWFLRGWICPTDYGIGPHARSPGCIDFGTEQFDSTERFLIRTPLAPSSEHPCDPAPVYRECPSGTLGCEFKHTLRGLNPRRHNVQKTT